MAMQVSFEDFISPSGAGQVSITPGFAWKALITWWGVRSSDSGSGTECFVGAGVAQSADGVTLDNEFSLSAVAQNGVDPSNTKTIANNKCITSATQSGVFEVATLGSVSAAIGATTTFDFTTSNAAQYRHGSLAIGGDDVTNTSLQEIATPTDAGTDTTVTFGFAADAIFIITGRTTSNSYPVTADDASLSIGWFTRQDGDSDGVGRGAMSTFSDEDGQDPIDALSRIDKVAPFSMANKGNAAVLTQINKVTFTATTAVIDWTTVASSAEYMYVLGVKGGQWATADRAALGAASGQMLNLTSGHFRTTPLAALWTHCNDVYASSNTAASLSFGGFTASGTGASWSCSSVSAAAPSETDRYWQQARAVDARQGTSMTADQVSNNDSTSGFRPGGFESNWTTGSGADALPMLLMGSNRQDAGVETISSEHVSPTSTGATKVRTDFGANAVLTYGVRHQVGTNNHAMIGLGMAASQDGATVDSQFSTSLYSDHGVATSDTKSLTKDTAIVIYHNNGNESESAVLSQDGTDLTYTWAVGGGGGFHYNTVAIGGSHVNQVDLSEISIPVSNSTTVVTKTLNWRPDVIIWFSAYTTGAAPAAKAGADLFIGWMVRDNGRTGASRTRGFAIGSKDAMGTATTECQRSSQAAYVAMNAMTGSADTAAAFDTANYTPAITDAGYTFTAPDTGSIAAHRAYVLAIKGGLWVSWDGDDAFNSQTGTGQRVLNGLGSSPYPVDVPGGPEGMIMISDCADRATTGAMNYINNNHAVMSIWGTDGWAGCQAVYTDKDDEGTSAADRRWSNDNRMETVNSGDVVKGAVNLGGVSGAGLGGNPNGVEINQYDADNLNRIQAYLAWGPSPRIAKKMGHMMQGHLL